MTKRSKAIIVDDWLMLTTLSIPSLVSSKFDRQGGRCLSLKNTMCLTLINEYD